MLKGLLLLACAAIFGVWWWRRTYKPSPLEIHYADLEAKQKVGNTAQYCAWATTPVVAMVGTGWGTTTLINPNNLAYNRPGKTWFNLRFPQVTPLASGLPQSSS